MSDCEHPNRRAVSKPSASFLFECEDCKGRFVTGVPGPAAAYLPPGTLRWLRDERPDLYERYVTKPREENERRRSAIMAAAQAKQNGKGD